MNAARSKFKRILIEWIRICVSHAFVAHLVETTPNQCDRVRRNDRSHSSIRGRRSDNRTDKWGLK